MKTKSKLSKNKTTKNKTTKNKTTKNLNKPKYCNEFCKSDYVSEIDKQNIEIAKGTNVPYNPQKKDRDFRISTCQNNFCNKDCKKKYKYYDKDSKTMFLKNMKNNFITNTSPKLIKTMKEKGAISYCDGFVYNPFNKNK